MTIIDFIDIIDIIDITLVHLYFFPEYCLRAGISKGESYSAYSAVTLGIAGASASYAHGR